MGQNRRIDRIHDDATQGSEQFLAGRNPVLEALRSDNLPDTVYLSGNGGVLRQISELAREKGIPVKMVSESKLSQMTAGANHQGAAASGSCGSYVSVEEILGYAKEKSEYPLIVICDEIQDPHNLGAIIRTAEAAGVHGIIIPKRRSASLNLTVGKTSAGAASHMRVARVSNLAMTMEKLKENGVWIYGTDASGENYTNADFKSGTAFVIGSEGFGIGRLVGEKCDAMLRLPMKGQVNSLNASVAAGIFIYEAVRQRDNNK
ncbi:MAG: 23S rRNA (guanosine(2251)-2'-O)-methyltransferase RlmB [Ruminococcus sp.]|nr:23S rRNA (guanosine(2251)-2'-O)-methyltransferase RlmB [Ruminococcus sp.]